MLSLLLHPLPLYLSEVTISAIVIGFTSPNSFTRLASLPLILICTHLCVSTALERTERTFWASLYGGSSIGWAIHYVEIALLSRWSYENRGPNPPSKQQLKNVESRHKDIREETKTAGFLEHLRYGYLVTFSFRNCGTPYEVRNVPHFSRKDPAYLPTRGTYLRHAAASAFICYLFLDLSSLGMQPEKNPILYSSERVPLFARLGDISREELLMRTGTSVGVWASMYCMLTLYQDIASFTCVMSDCDDVKSWRPAFGPLKEAYSMRRFWRYARCLPPLIRGFGGSK